MQIRILVDDLYEFSRRVTIVYIYDRLALPNNSQSISPYLKKLKLKSFWSSQVHYKLRCVLLFKGCEIELIKIILPGIPSVRPSDGLLVTSVNWWIADAVIVKMKTTFWRWQWLFLRPGRWSQNKDPSLIVGIAVRASGGYVVGMLCTHIRQLSGVRWGVKLLQNTFRKQTDKEIKITP